VDSVPVTVISERVQYYDKDGKLITESLKDYTRKSIRKEYSTLDAFLNVWTQAERKKAIIDELESQGVFLEALADTVGKDFDSFDLVCHVAFDQPPLTRRERAESVKKRNYFTKYGEKARAVLSSLLDKYTDEGIEHIEEINVLRLPGFSQFGTPMEILASFGGKEKYLQALQELEQQLYRAA
jgi:type I restriction enzyme R subunit